MKMNNKVYFKSFSEYFKVTVGIKHQQQENGSENIHNIDNSCVRLSTRDHS